MLVANVDQLVIVTSAAEPRIKPNLIDRLLVTAERAGIRPIICINKIDLIEPADLMPLVPLAFDDWLERPTPLRAAMLAALPPDATGAPTVVTSRARVFAVAMVASLVVATGIVFLVTKLTADRAPPSVTALVPREAETEVRPPRSGVKGRARRVAEEIRPFPARPASASLQQLNNSLNIY